MAMAWSSTTLLNLLPPPPVSCSSSYFHPTSLLLHSIRPTLPASPPSASQVLTISAAFVASSSSPRRTGPPPCICRAAGEYKFPDPIPEFAQAETEKFREHLLKKLEKKKDIFGDELHEVVRVCVEIFSTFLHTEYGGPGTLLVIPFVDMADTLEEQGLPGAPQAARAAVKWAQDHVDKDWQEWTSRARC